MKKKLTVILFSTFLLLIILLAFIGLSRRTITYQATMVEDGQESNVSIHLSYWRIDRLFSACMETS